MRGTPFIADTGCNSRVARHETWRNPRVAPRSGSPGCGAARAVASPRCRGGISLRKHRVDAKHRILSAFGFPAHPLVSDRGSRARVVSATGSGKTFTAASAALDMFPAGRVLAPTLDLLVQTAWAWRRVGHRSPMVAVCSLAGDPVLEELGAPGYDPSDPARSVGRHTGP
ncbi:DEAD/DEAH box helicase family protein [Streptomyces mauvecolor]